MSKIDKKQLPQLIVLIVLSVSIFGYFIFRMIAPTPAAAQAPVVKTDATPADKKVAAIVDPATDAPVPAPEPSEAMRDPFLPGVADPSALDAYQKSKLAPASETPAPPMPAPAERRNSSRRVTVPQVAPLPGMALPSASSGAVKPLPVAPPPAAPITWTVTGVLGGDGGVAILRDGETRRIVRQGDQLDGGLHVSHISRSSVTLERDGLNYHLPLGGSKDAQPKAHASDPAPAAAPAETPALPIAP